MTDQGWPARNGSDRPLWRLLRGTPKNSLLKKYGSQRIGGSSLSGPPISSRVRRFTPSADAGLRRDVCAAAVAGGDDVLRGQRLVGAVHRLHRHAQAARQLAHAGDLLPGLQQAVAHELGDLPPDLLVRRFLAGLSILMFIALPRYLLSPCARLTQCTLSTQFEETLCRRYVRDRDSSQPRDWRYSRAADTALRTAGAAKCLPQTVAKVLLALARPEGVHFHRHATG